MKRYFEKRRKLKEKINLLEEDIKRIEGEMALLNKNLECLDGQYLELDKKLVDLEKYREESEKELDVFYKSLMVLLGSLGILLFGFMAKFSLGDLGRLLLILGPINALVLGGREVKILGIKRRYQKYREENAGVIREIREDKRKILENMHQINDSLKMLVNKLVKDRGKLKETNDKISVLNTIIIEKYEMVLEREFGEENSQREEEEMERKMVL